MPTPQKLTPWVRIMTAGKTIDGREYPEHVLEQMAETYNPAEYCATINYEHARGYISLGQVRALKTEKDNQKRCSLLAQLEPNAYFRELNASGQKLFTSTEFVFNFCGTNKAYLIGLALTDTPASVGTSEIRLSAQNIERTRYVDEAPIALSFDFTEPDLEPNQSLIHKIAVKLGIITHPEESAMPEELKKLIETQTATISELTASVKTLTEQLAKTDEKKIEPFEPAVETLTAEKKTLEEKLAAAEASKTALEAEVEKLKKSEIPGTSIKNTVPAENAVIC